MNKGIYAKLLDVSLYIQRRFDLPTTIHQFVHESLSQNYKSHPEFRRFTVILSNVHKSISDSKYWQ